MFDMIGYQRELFFLFDEFFQQATGKTAEKFAAVNRFSETAPHLSIEPGK
jgi:hypothetical protein